MSFWKFASSFCTNLKHSSFSDEYVLRTFTVNMYKRFEKIFNLIKHQSDKRIINTAKKCFYQFLLTRHGATKIYFETH